MDEAGFAPTLPTGYSWFPVGQRLTVPYQAPQERRVNAIGAFFSHGPQAGGFLFETYAAVPKSRAASEAPLPRKSLAQIAAQHGLMAAEVGVLDAIAFLAFVWKVAGRPALLAAGWRRQRPLVIVLDNYSVHRSQQVQDALPELKAADVYLLYLPSYCPELSRIEPIWHVVKHHGMTRRSYALLGDLKRAVDAALQWKADDLLAAHAQSEPLLQRAA